MPVTRPLGWCALALVGLLALSVVGVSGQPRIARAKGISSNLSDQDYGQAQVPLAQDSTSPYGRILQFHNISIEQGLPSATVTAILQDSRGFMWFGTDEGLARYDGYGFTIFQADRTDAHSLSDNLVIALAEDSTGVLWVGTQAGLDRLVREEGRFVHYRVERRDRNATAANPVLALFSDPAGILWVGAADGLYHFDPNNGSFVSHQRGSTNTGGLGDAPVWAIDKDVQGTLWVGARRGIYEWPVESQRFFYHRPDSDPARPDHLAVRSIVQDQAGRIWAGSAGGGFHGLDQPSGKLIQYLIDPQDLAGYTYNNISALLVDRRNVLWIGTRGGGLYQFDPDRGQLFPYQTDPHVSNSLSSNYITALYQDQAGLLWIGTQGGGINRVDPSRERFISYQHDPGGADGLSHNRVLAMLEDRQGGLWIGTDGAGLDRLDRSTGQWLHYRHEASDPNSIASDYVVALHQDRAGGLWIGTRGGGLDRLTPESGEFVHYRADPLDPASLSTNQVASIFQDREGTLWVGVVATGLDRLANPEDTTPAQARFEHVIAAPGGRNRLNSGVVQAMVQDADGSFWIATLGGGLNHYDPLTGRFSVYLSDVQDPYSLHSDQVQCLLLDRAGQLWVGTTQGLHRLDRQQGRFWHYGRADGLPGDEIMAIQQDHLGSYWISTDKGLARFDLEAGAFKAFGVADGLQGYQFTSASGAGSNGELFFGGTNGLNVFHPDRIQDNPYVPPVFLTALRWEGADLIPWYSLDAAGQVTLRWPANDLEFEFAALSYNQPERNQYAYLLEGFDADWSYLGTRRFGRYTNLPGGTYTLRLMGSNSDGVWNRAGATLTIVVVPPVWQTGWFRAMALLVLAAAAVAAYRMRVRGVEARTHRLAQQVEERTREINQRRQELEALYRADEELYSHLRLDHVLQALVDIAVDLLRADKSAVLCWDDSRDRLSMRVARGFSAAAMSELSFRRDEGTIGRVVATGETVTVEDAVEDPARALERPEAIAAVLAEGVRSFMQIPLKLDGTVFGVFNVSYGRPHAFGQEEQRLFSVLAQRAAQAIENAQRFDAEKRRAEQFRVLAEVGRRIGLVLDTEKILSQVVRLVRDNLGYYHVGIGLIEGDELVYRCGAGELWDDPHFQFKPARLKLGQEGVSGWVAATGRPLLVPDVRKDDRYVWMQGSRTLSELTVPILIKGKVIGVLDAQNDSLNAFDYTDLAMMQSLAYQAGAAVENAQLYQQAQAAAVVQERTRLARDLHDAVTQTLFSASLLAEVLPATWETDQEEGRQLLRELRLLSRGALAEMRALLLELRPAVLVEADLGDLLRQLAEAATGRTGIPVQVSVAGPCELPEDVQVALYRIAQEALNNVVKHARATQVAVRLECAPLLAIQGAGEPALRVELEITDNGRGFDLAHVPPNHLGLGIIQERAQAIAAQAIIDSQPGQGTRVAVCWSLPTAREQAKGRPQ